jgi:hypothetical protein
MLTCHRYTLPILLFASIFFFTGCSQTTVSGLWKKSDYTGEPFASILVVGLTGDLHNRILWENVMADKLRQSGIKTVITTSGVFPGSKMATENDIMDYVSANGVEGLLVTRLVDTREEEVYYPPTGGYYGGPYGYYNRFNHYYSHAYDRISSPGYTATLTTFMLETNLYKSDTKELIWSMSSDTFEPKSFNQLVDSVSKKVLETLQKDQLI